MHFRQQPATNRTISRTISLTTSGALARSATTHDEARLRKAIQQRDKRMDGVFYYGVRTTKIFCRPSCASRQPAPENVVFFDSIETAVRSGFRACLRCYPDDASGSTPHAELVARVCRLIESDLSERHTLARLGRETSMSPYHLQRTFKRCLGITPQQYAAALRMRGFKAGIKAGSAITDAIYEAGYGASSRLYERSGAELGMTPSAYREGASQQRIRFVITRSPLGLLMVAATNLGVCSVAMGDSREQMLAGLREEFPAAVLQPSTSALRTHVAALLDALKGSEPTTELPLDIRGTAFQKRVWDELRRIPAGETATYRQIATKLGQPTAARAVARACAGNPVAVLVPCHRVVRSNGELAGYRWGVARKRQLLRMEKAAVVKHSAANVVGQRKNFLSQ